MRCVIQGREVDLVVGDVVKVHTYNWMGDQYQRGVVTGVDDVYNTFLVKCADGSNRVLSTDHIIAKLAK